MSIPGNDERIGQALQALRAADAGGYAGAEAEARAILAFRRQRQRRRGIQRLAIAAAIAAIGVVAVTSYELQHRARPAAIQASAAADSREVLTPFFPLMPSSPRLETGVIIRVTVPAAVMQRVGLPVVAGHLADPVQADVLVGQDDLARAIRFVTYGQ